MPLGPSGGCRLENVHKRGARLVVCQNWCAVPSDDLKSYYLAKLTEAEHNAAAAKDPQESEKWRKIADGYRSLADPPTRGKPTKQ